MDIEEHVPALPVPVELPADPSARLALAEQCWAALTDKQRVALTVFRNSRLSARRADREGGANRITHSNWVRENKNYATIVRLWQGVAGSEALDKDRLLARQDDIVETLLTPKPVIYQGLPVFDPKRPGELLEEVEAGAASRANEVLMKASGLLKDKDLEINVGIIGPSLNIQVVHIDGSIQDYGQQGVEVALPEAEAIEAEFTEVTPDGWVDGP